MTKLFNCAALLTLGIPGGLLLGFTVLAIAVHEAWFLAAILVAGVIIAVCANDHRRAVEDEAAAAAHDPVPAAGVARIPIMREPGEF